MYTLFEWLYSQCLLTYSSVSKLSELSVVKVYIHLGGDTLYLCVYVWPKEELWNFPLLSLCRQSITKINGLRDSLFKQIWESLSHLNYYLSVQYLAFTVAPRNLLREVIGAVLVLDPPRVHWPDPSQKTHRPTFKGGVLVSPTGSELCGMWREQLFTLSALSFSTPYLPPKPLAASVWEECISTSATYSWPTALWEKSRMEWMTR